MQYISFLIGELLPIDLNKANIIGSCYYTYLGN